MAVYHAIVNSDEFSAFSHSPALIDARAGGEFSMFDGQIVGRAVELIAGERIIQAWRVAGWDPGVYSLVRFSLQGSATSTELTFDQSGHPLEAQSELEGGWHAMYWNPLREYLSS